MKCKGILEKCVYISDKIYMREREEGRNKDRYRETEMNI